MSCKIYFKVSDYIIIEGSRYQIKRDTNGEFILVNAASKYNNKIIIKNDGHFKILRNNKGELIAVKPGEPIDNKE